MPRLAKIFGSLAPYKSKEVSMTIDQVRGEPNARKLARSVLKTSSGSDSVAEFNIWHSQEILRRFFTSIRRTLNCETLSLLPSIAYSADFGLSKTGSALC